LSLHSCTSTLSVPPSFTRYKHITNALWQIRLPSAPRQHRLRATDRLPDTSETRTGPGNYAQLRFASSGGYPPFPEHSALHRGKSITASRLHHEHHPRCLLESSQAPRETLHRRRKAAQGERTMARRRRLLGARIPGVARCVMRHALHAVLRSI
jgi:hypothetical protein